jgi:predicted transcriptional regulator of viral defense system
MFSEKQKFDFLNLSIRGLVVLLMAKKKGYVCTQDVRRLYSLHKRSKRSAGFLINMVENGHLKRASRDRYVLTPKAEMALDSLARRLQIPLDAEDEQAPIELLTQ